MNPYNVNKISICGDLSMVGVKEQISSLRQYLDRLPDGVPADSVSHEIDLTGVLALDACGCQLLAVFLRVLRQRGVKVLSLTLNDDYRGEIHRLGFDDELFSGESA